MRKLFLLASLAAISVMMSGCYEGLVKKVVVKYTTANYGAGTVLTQSYTGVATETSNLFVGADLDGTGGHLRIVNAASSVVSSDSAGLWIYNILGDAIDPKEADHLDKLDGVYKYKSNAIVSGYVRVSGDVTYDIDSGIFTGTGNVIQFNAGADISGSGKWQSLIYKGVAKVKLTCYDAFKFPVTDGVLGAAEPVHMTITIPAVKIFADYVGAPT